MPGASPASRRWGFHALAEPHAAHVVARSGVGPGDLVLDLGAGHGALTEPLARTGARILAFELHGARANRLRARFSDVARVTIVRADVSDLRLPRRPFRVVANPPFAVAVAVLRRLTAPGSRLQRADLVLPSHLARRWAAGQAPGAGRWSRFYELRIDHALPPAAFVPRGPHAAVLVIERRR